VGRNLQREARVECVPTDSPLTAEVWLEEVWLLQRMFSTTMMMPLWYSVPVAVLDDEVTLTHSPHINLCARLCVVLAPRSWVSKNTRDRGFFGGDDFMQ
jgi:hypothetical protein